MVGLKLFYFLSLNPYPLTFSNLCFCADSYVADYSHYASFPKTEAHLSDSYGQIRWAPFNELNLSITNDHYFPFFLPPFATITNTGWGLFCQPIVCARITSCPVPKSAVKMDPSPFMGYWRHLIDLEKYPNGLVARSIDGFWVKVLFVMNDWIYREMQGSGGCWYGRLNLVEIIKVVG